MSEDRDELVDLLDLVLHDLRNPLATLVASVSYIRRAAPGDPEIPEAIVDCEHAAERLARAFDQLGWIGGGPADLPQVEDLRETVRRAVDAVEGAVEVTLPDAPVERLAGLPTQHLLEVFLRASVRNGPRVTASLDADGVVTITDDGRAVPPEIRAAIFTVAGQKTLRKLAYPRYAKVAGYVSAKALADKLGIAIELGGEDGAAVARVTVPVAQSTS